MFFNDRILNILGYLNIPLELRKIKLLENMYIDIVGALVPIVFSLILSRYLFFREKLPKMYLLGILFSSVGSLKFSKVDSNGITIEYIFIDIFIAILCFFIVYLPRWIKLYRESLHEIKNNFLISFSVAYIYASISALITDLLYLPSMDFNEYIGGMGFGDGIFLSALFVGLPLIFLISFTELLSFYTFDTALRKNVSQNKN